MLLDTRDARQWTVEFHFLEMKVPHEIQNDYCRVKWMLEQAATIAMKVSIDEMVKSVSKMTYGK